MSPFACMSARRPTHPESSRLAPGARVAGLGLIAALLALPGCAASSGESRVTVEAAPARQSDGGNGGQRNTDALSPADGAGAQDDGFEPFRSPGPRGMETIFSPLDWPDPDARRLGSGVPGPDYWQNTADHEIDVTLDESERRLDATQTITYTNNAPHELDFIWLHLEQNLFDPSSRGARMTKPGDRFGNRAGFEGGVEVSRVAVSGSDRPSREIELAIHDTLGRLDLNSPLEPGESMEIDLQWRVNIPPYGSDRLGIEEVEQGTVFQLAQWFPAPVRYDDVYGWNTMPYLGQGEFYTDFGSYDVRITVPRDHICGATGVLQNPREVLTEEQIRRLDEARGTQDTVMIRSPGEVGDPASRPEGEGPLTWHFKAEKVRTFAWASSDAFIWDAATVADSEADTLVQSLYPKEGRKLWSDSTDMLRFAIEGYNERWMDYPYPTAINVNGTVGGMEYPMILFCGNRTSRQGLYGVTTHEIAHNWFPMIINTDERRHAWMDEGFNTFMNIYSNRERFPDKPYRRGDPRRAARRMLEPNQQPIVTFPDQVASLGWLQYHKPGIGLYVLREGVLGPERFDRAFNRYMNEWAYKSPRPSDFFRVMEDAAGEDLSWFWRGWFYETGVLDQEITSVEPEYEPAGRDASEDEGEGEGEPERTGTYLLTFRSNRELVMPVEYEITYANGDADRHRLPVEVWHTTREWTTRHDADGREIVSVEVDPRHIFPDAIPENNTWTAEGHQEDAQAGEAEADAEG